MAGSAGVQCFSGESRAVLIMPLFNKYVPLGDEHADLAERLIKLAERAHTKVRGVFKFDMSKRTKAANAAADRHRQYAPHHMGDTLINEFTPDEIETVLAHELGHHVNRDIPLMIIFGMLSTLVSLYLASLALIGRCRISGSVPPADPARVARADVDPLSLRSAHHAAGKCLLTLAGAAGRWIFPASDELTGRVCLRDDAAGKPKPVRSGS